MLNELAGIPMTEELKDDRNTDDRRKLIGYVDATTGSHPVVPAAPRRSGEERRVSDRRVVSLLVERERREDERREEERRQAARRQAGGRRTRAPRFFSVEEAALIVAAARTPDPVPCPRCEAHLALRPPVTSEGRSVWTVNCPNCRCRLRIENL